MKVELPENLLATKHAVDRWRERTGSKLEDEKARNRIRNRIRGAKHIGGDRWYSRGFVFAVKDNLIITVMRPEEVEVQRKVTEAHR